jgi:hypothetical protein
VKAYSIINMMNIRLFSLICFVVIGISVQAGMYISEAQEVASSPVKIRAARYPDYVRIVLTADEPLVKAASVIMAKNKIIKIDFRQAGVADAGGRGNFGIAFETAKGPAVNDIPLEIIKSVNLVVKGGSCL